MKRHVTLIVTALALTAASLCGCGGRSVRHGHMDGAARLGRIAEGTRRVAIVEGRGKAVAENRLGRIEIEFEMFYEPGRILELRGELEPGLLPFYGDVEVTSTPDTTLAYVNGMPLLPEGESYPGPVLHPALISVCLGGEYMLDWLEKQDCVLAEKMECGGIGFEFDLDEDTGRVKSWTLKHENPDGSYDGFLYKTRPQGGVELPEILTGMAHPFEVSVYVEYYEISATIR